MMVGVIRVSIDVNVNVNVNAICGPRYPALAIEPLISPSLSQLSWKFWSRSISNQINGSNSFVVIHDGLFVIEVATSNSHHLHEADASVLLTCARIIMPWGAHRVESGIAWVRTSVGLG